MYMRINRAREDYTVFEIDAVISFEVFSYFRDFAVVYAYAPIGYAAFDICPAFNYQFTHCSSYLLMSPLGDVSEKISA